MRRSSPPVTALLRRLREGDEGAGAELLAVLYVELRQMAEKEMSGERAGHTLQPTALVNEFWARLMDAEERPVWGDRRHFLRYAAQAMRNLLVDHARARGALKREAPPGPADESLTNLLDVYASRSLDVLILHEALDRLAGMDDELVRLVELRFFVGLSIPETADAMGISHATVERRWRTARAWLHAELSGRD